MPAHIESEDMKPVLEVPGERVERVGTPGIAVHADDRRSIGLAPFEVMQGEIVHPQGLAGGCIEVVIRAAFPQVSRRSRDCLCARQAGAYPAGGIPARVSRSGRPLASVACSSATAGTKRTQHSVGCAIEPRKLEIRRGRDGSNVEGNSAAPRQRGRRSAAVEDASRRKGWRRNLGDLAVRPGGCAPRLSAPARPKRP